ncbi:MAG: hypothetical protein K9N51_00780 [Candidatus Pacebacteria bacterium]|nr:hypothetical protein [Candidatus Paceibacterota bacterium]
MNVTGIAAGKLDWEGDAHACLARGASDIGGVRKTSIVLFALNSSVRPQAAKGESTLSAGWGAILLTTGSSPVGSCMRSSPVGSCMRSSPLGSCTRSSPVGLCTQSSPVGLSQ